MIDLDNIKIGDRVIVEDRTDPNNGSVRKHKGEVYIVVKVLKSIKAVKVSGFHLNWYYKHVDKIEDFIGEDEFKI